ncbi:MAG: cell division protein ZapE [Woeseia sp.]
MTIRTAYQESLTIHGHVRDPAQQSVVDRLADLEMRLMQEQKPLRKLRRRLGRADRYPDVSGIYLWGGVGRGKTFLMDLFFKTLPIEKKTRVHFHRMISDVHDRLKSLGDMEDPLDKVAADIARQTDVFCFDEFYVSDIADAMILGRLLGGLFMRGVTLLATSNSPPADLYRNGLQRDRFTPAIELLEAHTNVVELHGVIDYRLRLLQQSGTYLTPAGEDATARLTHCFLAIASGDVAEGRVLLIRGRGIRTQRCGKGVAWFDFQEICGGPRSQQDYIEIARWYPTVIVSDIPELAADLDDQARRFIALVDEFYDRKVKLLVSAATTIECLYAGQKLSFEFERTRSRFIEMQSTAYLHAPHLS